MSKETEEAVLKILEKLDVLDERTNSTDKIIKEVVLKKLENLETEVKGNSEKIGTLEAAVKVNSEKIGTLEAAVKANSEKIGTLEAAVKVNSEKIGTLETLVKDNCERIGNLEIEHKDIYEVITDLRQRFIVFDYEINRKIDTLFDANTINHEKHNFFEEKIISLDAKNFNHDIRISNLEDKVLTA